MLDPVTIRYADALFNLARSTGRLEDVRRDVEHMERELAKEGVGAFVFDARISAATRREKIQPLFQGATPLFGDFVSLLFDKRREEVLRKLGEAFHRRVLREQGGAEGVVESAEALDSAEMERIAAALGATLKKDLALENQIEPELIGGVRVIVENKMIDLSLRGRLAALRKRMLEAPMPSGHQSRTRTRHPHTTDPDRPRQMDLRPAEVTSILEKEIASYQGESTMQSVGTVLSVGDGVARVWGLDDCMMNELLEFGSGVRGVALNLEEDNVGCVLLGDATKVKEGD